MDASLERNETSSSFKMLGSRAAYVFPVFVIEMANSKSQFRVEYSSNPLLLQMAVSLEAS